MTGNAEVLPCLDRLVQQGLAGQALTLRFDPGEKSGWQRFAVWLQPNSSRAQPRRLLAGIHSRGGGFVHGWIELLSYRPANLAQPQDPTRPPTWEVSLFRQLLACVPPGGHLMVTCEGSPDDAYLQLIRGVPGALTRYGEALLLAGLPKVRFFYLPEGGWEGQPKLWAEKPPSDAYRRQWQAETRQLLEWFVQHPTDMLSADNLVARARRLLTDPLSPPGT